MERPDKITALKLNHIASYIVRLSYRIYIFYFIIIFIITFIYMLCICI